MNQNTAERAGSHLAQLDVYQMFVGIIVIIIRFILLNVLNIQYRIKLIKYSVNKVDVEFKRMHTDWESLVRTNEQTQCLRVCTNGVMLILYIAEAYNHTTVCSWIN